VPISVMEEVVAPDESTLVVRWKRTYPGAGVLQVGGSTNLGLPALPRHILEGLYHEAQWNTLGNHPYWTVAFVGLGPYKLDRWEQGSFLEGAAFGSHVLGRAKIERLRVEFIPDTNAALAAMRAGTIHLATEGSLTFEQALQIKREWASTNGGTFLWTAASIRHFLFQLRPELVSSPALLDVRVRKALAHSLDKVSMSEVLWGGEGILLDSIFSPRVDYYPVIDRATVKYPYDLAATERLMAEAGYSRDADGMYASPAGGRLSLEVRSTGGGPSDTERSTAASGWRQAGFDTSEGALPGALSLDGQERASFKAISTNAQSATDTTMSAAFVTAQISRPENRWNGINRGGWSNPEYDRLVEAFNTTLDPNERIRQRASMAQVLTDELPAIILYYNLNPAPYVSALTGPVQTTPDTTGYVNWNIHEWELH
jgi:peptide/nickel transport system substrate-binding protein